MSVRQKYKDLLNTIGEASLHYLYPNDFEYYAMSLELVSNSGPTEMTVDYFVFPVMPSNYNNSSTTLTNVRKTNSGVLSIRNSGFVPIDLKINGDFGRQFKVLIGSNEITAAAWKFSTAGGDFGGNLQIPTPPFNLQLKTGYGAIKILEAICNKSRKVDNLGYPYTLYLYNPAMGENYIVEVENFTVKQEVSRSRIYSYSLQMKALGIIQSTRDLINKGPLAKSVFMGGIELQAELLKSLL